MGTGTLVLLPTYNERENVVELISQILKALPGSHVMVVDDNSPDGTGTVVSGLATSEPRLSLFSRPGKEGLGKAYLDAFQKVLANREVATIVMMDADFSHDPAHLPALIAARAEADIVVGSRYVRGGGIAGWEWWRYQLSFWGNVYARLVTGLPPYDLTAGFYAVNTARLRELDFATFNSSGYAFQIEFKYRLHQIGATFTEVPITFQRRRGGESKITSHIVGEGLIAPWRLRFKK